MLNISVVQVLGCDWKGEEARPAMPDCCGLSEAVANYRSSSSLRLEVLRTLILRMETIQGLGNI